MNKMKRYLLPLLALLLLLPGCYESDPLDSTVWVTNIDATDNVTTGDVVTDNLTVNNNTLLKGPVALEGDGMVWIESRPDLDRASIRANGKPTWVTRGDFGGFSLPVFAADDEELFAEICVLDRWMGPAWTELLATGDQPGGMAVYRGKLYIPCEGDDTVQVWDGETLSISGNVGDRPRYSYVYNNRLFVTCRGDDEVWVFNGTSWALSGNVGDKPEGMVSDGTLLYVACEGDDEIWTYNGAVWVVDAALGNGGVAGAVGTEPQFMYYYGGDVYVGCDGVDDDVWIRSGGAWAKDADVGNMPQEFTEHDGDLHLNCYADDTVWVKSGGAWAVFTNVMTTIGNAPVGLIEYNDSLFSACADSVWSDSHTVDAHAVPFWNENSDFSISGDEPMFFEEYEDVLYCSCKANDSIWVYSGETCMLCLHMWVTDAQGAATDAFRLELDHSAFTCSDVVPLTDRDTVREIQTGICAAKTSFCAHLPLDMTGREGDDSMALRLYRIAASDEIAGEVVIQHIGVIFKCNKLGSLEP